MCVGRWLFVVCCGEMLAFEVCCGCGSCCCKLIGLDFQKHYTQSFPRLQVFSFLTVAQWFGQFYW